MLLDLLAATWPARDPHPATGPAVECTAPEERAAAAKRMCQWALTAAGVQICIRHCGTCQFRGVPEVQTVLQISRGALDGRVFPPGFANPKKATPMGPAKGLQAVLVLAPQ